MSWTYKQFDPASTYDTVVINVEETQATQNAANYSDFTRPIQLSYAAAMNRQQFPGAPLLDGRVYTRDFVVATKLWQRALGVPETGIWSHQMASDLSRASKTFHISEN